MMRWTLTQEGPVVIRYGRSSVDQHDKYPYGGFTFGQWETMAHGGDCALLAVGSMVREAIDTSALLEKKRIHAEVINCSTVRPVDERTLLRLKDKPVFTMEEHMHGGGFGAQVCTWAAANGLPAPRHMFAIDDVFVPHGKRVQLLELQGLLPEQMAQVIEENLKDESK